MKKNMLMMVGLVVFLAGFNGCRPCEKEGFVPGKSYNKDGLDPNTKGARITESNARAAMANYYNNYFLNPPPSGTTPLNSYFPEYEVFSIHELVEFVISHQPTAVPSYLVIRHGIFPVPVDPNNPTGPTIPGVKSILYLTDVNHVPIRSSDTTGEILFFEELRRCPPDTNCNTTENVRNILFPPAPEDNEEEDDNKKDK